MANIIKLKRSETAGSIPTSSDLEVGEICMNMADKKLYTKKTDGTIIVVSSETTGSADLELISTDTSSSAGPGLDLFRNSFSPFDSDELGKIEWSGENDNSDKKVYIKLQSKLIDASAASEDGELEVHVMDSGTLTKVAAIKSDGFHFEAGHGLHFSDGTTITTATGLGGDIPEHTHTVVAIDGTVATTSSAGSSGVPGEVQDDTTPQLGGDLDLNNNNISGTGTITATSFHGDGSGLTGVGVDLSGVQQDILNLAINQAIADNRIAFNLTDSFVDGFEDTSGIDDGGNITDCVRDDNEFVCTESGTAVDSNYVLVVQSDTTNGSSTFVDESSIANSVSRAGTPTHSTAQSKVPANSSSIYFDGSGDKVTTIDAKSDYAFGTGDFTIEGWIRWDATGQNKTLIGNRRGEENGAWMFYISTSNNLAFSSGTAILLASSATISTNTWTHCAIVRDSGTLRIYKDGVQASTASNSNNFTDTHTIYFGGGDSQGNGDFAGYMDGIRVSKTCRYPNGTTFTPYTENLGLVASATGTLISDVQTAPESTTTASGVILYEDQTGVATLGTDLKVYFSADNKSTWTEASSYSTPTTYTGSKKLVKLGNTTVTGGTQVAIKAEWANQSSASKVTRLHGWAINY